MNNKIFSLQYADNEKVVIKIDANDPLTVAMNPFVSSDMEYITVTRGPVQVLTVIRKDGTTYGFHWGAGGYTSISENLEILKKKVISFIENESNIMLNYCGGKVKAAIVMYNTFFEKWQLRLELSGKKECSSAHVYFEDVADKDEAIKKAMKMDAMPQVKTWRKVSSEYQEYEAILMASCVNVEED